MRPYTFGVARLKSGALAQEIILFTEGSGLTVTTLRLMQRRIVRLFALLVVFTSAAISVVSVPAHGGIGSPGSPGVLSAANAPAPAGGIYTAIKPNRVLDTRIGQGAPTPGDNAIFSVRVAGKGAVPARATAVIVNLTVTNTTEAGFLSVWPTGQARPLVSSLNPERRAQTIANLVTVPVGRKGQISLYTQRQADVIVDVQGYFTNAAIGSEGRLSSISPRRFVDTRTTGGRFGVRTARTFDLTGIGGITRKSRAAVLNVTVDDASEPGYWSAYPANTPRPDASNLNIEFTGQTIANQVVVGLTNGRFTVYSQRGGQLIVDVVGSYTGADAKRSTTGRFVPVSPTRLIDTRGGFTPSPSSTTEIPVLNRAGLRANGVSAVSMNLTVTETTNVGYFTAWPARTYRPLASSVNAAAPDQTIANHVVTPISAAGVGVFTQNGGEIIADISGYFTGQATAARLPPPVPVPNPASPGPSTDYAYSLALGPSGLTGPARGGDPIRWDTCRSIRYVVNYGGNRQQYQPLVREAFDRLSAASGIRFVDRGPSSFIPTSNSPHPISPQDAYAGRADFDLLVAFAGPDQTDMVPGGVAGVANVAWVSAGGAKPIYVLASVVIDHKDVSDSPPWSSVGAGPVLLHELGHVVGLTHVSRTQVMSPVASPGGPVTYQGGDLAGLWREGSYPVQCGERSVRVDGALGATPNVQTGWVTDQ
jgi:hypothetical protein